MLKDEDRIFKNLYNDLGWDIDSAIKMGDWSQTKEHISKGKDWIIKEIKDSELRGRGGAGFPTGLKLSFAPKELGSRPHYLVINADESEPGTCKDRDILRFEPQKLIEGCLITSYAISAHTCYIYIRGEYFREGQILQEAINQSYQKNFLGKNACGSGWDLDIYLHYGAGAYICGEETALLESLEGKKGQPRFKPPFPENVGLYGKPTTINNTESFASVPEILSQGGQWFADLGVPNSGGTKCFSVTGNVKNPANFEVPMGTPFSDLLKLAGGLRKGRTLKGVIPGGSSTPLIPAAKAMKMTMDNDSIEKAGSMLGAGSVIVMDDTTCMVKALTRLAHFYYDESCGQCTPCREGTGWMYRVLKRIMDGRGKSEDLELLLSVQDKMLGNTICALADGAAMPIESFIRHFRKEFEYYIKHGKSMVENDG